jgi:hypothetical protein
VGAAEASLKFRWFIYQALKAGFLLAFVATSWAKSPGMSKDTALPLVHEDEWSRCCRFSTIGVSLDRIDFLRPYAGPAAARIRRTLKLRGMGDPVDIVITRDLEDFRHAMPTVAHRTGSNRVGDWVAGIAFPANRLVILRLSHFPAREIRSTLIHELAHVYVAEAARLRRVPRWFNEGVAMMLSDENTLQHLESILAVQAAGSMPDLEELDWAFTAHRSQIGRSYAASFAFLRWAVESRGGTHLIQELLQRLATDQDFAMAFQSVFGGTVGELQEQWESDTNAGRWFPLIFRFGDIIWFSMVVIFIWGVVVTVRGRRRTLAKMEVQESFIYGDDLSWETVDRATGKNWWARRKSRRERARKQAHRASFEVIDCGDTEEEEDEKPLVH